MLYIHGRHNDDIEPVIPSFPLDEENNFTGILTGSKYHYAELRVLKEDPDVLLNKLVEDYPALPKILLENYIMIPMMQLGHFLEGNIFQIFITKESAVVRNTNSGEMLDLWSSQPMKEIS